jgi:glutaredoxin
MSKRKKARGESKVELKTKMNRTLFVSSLLFLFFGFLIIFSIMRDQSPTNQNLVTEPKIILFYGDTCPHCKIVEKYLDDNQIAAKVSFVQKEVYSNKGNAALLTTKAEFCGLPTNSVGVPFLFDGQNCFIGDQDIIKFFDDKVKSL